MLKLLGVIHDRLVHRPRARVIADMLAPWLPENGRVIDVGCGDGAVAAGLLERRPGLRIEGYDVLARDNVRVPVHAFDGRHLPLADGSVDAVILVDVLHHCERPEELLGEAARVSKGIVVIKDHRLSYPGARLLLRLMDWVSNRPHGVVLPYNYWRESQWRDAWCRLGLQPREYRGSLGLYPQPFSLALDTGLHFAAVLERRIGPQPTLWERAYQAFETPEQELRKFTERLRGVGADRWDRRSGIVEVCCGRGSGLRSWHALGFTDVVGVDYSPALVATHRGPGRCVIGDARQLPLATGSRDVAVVQGGLHHLLTTDDVDRALGEMGRVVTAGGRVVVIEPWLTPFLRIVHALCGMRMMRRLWPKLDALATMIDEERVTYERWLHEPEELLAVIRTHIVTERLTRRFGKLVVVGTPVTRSPAPIRVLRVITRLNIGGPSIQAIRLSSALTPEGFDTLLVHGRLGDGEGDMSYLLSGSAVRTQHLHQLQRPIAPWSDLRAAAALFRAMCAFRPHILHTHMAKAGLLGRTAAVVYNLTHPSARMRVVHTYHGHVLEGYFSGWTTKVFIGLERALARVTDRLLGVSSRVRDDLLLRYRIGSADTFTVLPLGLDLEGFAAIGDADRAAARRALDIGLETRVVTSVGRLTAVKNHSLFLEMASRVAADVPDVVFLIVGDGELRRELEAETRAHGLDGRVRFLGWRRDLGTIYGATDLFVLTSRNEGTPVALIEAMAAGVPGVSTDVGGVRDVIVDDSMGAVVPADDAETLARTAAGLLADPDRRGRMGAAAREAVLARFRFERLVQDVADLYRRLLQNRRSGDQKKSL